MKIREQKSFEKKHKNGLTKIYIAGKITGLEYSEAVKNFNDAREHLKLIGYINITNPINLTKKSVEWQYAMDICLEELKNCDAIFMLKNWKYSKGAKIERKLAKSLKLKIIYQ